MKEKKTKLLIPLFLLLVSANAWAQRTISGTVTDEKGEGLIGATVLVRGTNTGTATDVEGKYSITLPEGGNTLIFTYVGYESKEVTVGASNVINVSLSAGAEQLKEVVVTALGIEREKKSLGYSTQKVGGDEIRKSGEVNVVQGLAAKAAGVQVVASGGTPGASSKILIRGNSSFGNNQPLFIIDGIPLDNQTVQSSGRDYPFNADLQGVNNSNRAVDINPADIESMTVLKGPAAAALYGIRAGNGAIVITTKRGKRGQAFTVDVGSNVSIDRINRIYDIQQVYAQGIDGDYLPGETPSSWGPKNSLLGITPHDNVKEFFQTGVTYTNDVSLAAGNEKSSFRLSLGNTDQKGIVPNSKFSRTSVRLNAQTDVGKFVTVSAGANFIQSGGNRLQNGSNLSGVMLSLMRAPSSYDLAAGYENPDGTQRNYFPNYDNPYWTVNKNPFKDKNTRFVGNIAVTYKPLDWLNFTYRSGIDTYTDKRKGVFEIGSLNVDGAGGEITEDALVHRELYQDIIATFTKQFENKIGLSITLGNNLNQRDDGNVFARGRNLNIPGFHNLSNASTLYGDETTTIFRSAALFFDANISYNNMLFLGVTGRNEWVSTFPREAKKSFFYPSTTLSFVFSELEALKESKVLSFGKLRASYAQVGKSPSPYQTNTLYAIPFLADGFTDGLNFPYNGQAGFGTSNVLGNDKLVPERVNSIEFGTELGFFNDRLKLDFQYYVQKSKDILILRPLPSTTGFRSILDNAGEMQNKGIELVLSGQPVKLKDFGWDIAVNFTANRNKVTKLFEGTNEQIVQEAFGAVDNYAIVGQPFGVLYGTAWERNANGELIIGPDGLPIQTDLRQVLGNPYPDWTSGIRNTFRYKGFSLSVLFDIRKGGDIWNGTYGRLTRLGQMQETADRETAYIIKGVKASDGKPNDIAVTAFDYFARFLGDNGTAGEQLIQDGSWVRLRELSLTYSAPSFVNFLSALDFSITGRNLWLYTKYYKGSDPETSLTGAGSDLQGLEYFNMPNTASVNIGIRATFK